MIPFCSLFYGFAALAAITVIPKIYSRYRETKDENMGNFFKALLPITAFFILSALPGGIIKNLFWAEMIYMYAWVPFYFGLFFFIKIALNIWNAEKFEHPFLLIITALIIATFILNVIYFSPAETLAYKNFSVCLEKSPRWLLTINGITVVLLLLINVILFIGGGLKSEKKLVRTRSFLIGSGLFLLMISLFLVDIIVPNFPKLNVLTFVAGANSLIGILLLYSGIQYKIN